MDLQNLKVALTHDYLREYGGAERVLEVIHEIFPNAPLYTAYYNPTGLGAQAEHFKDWDIRTSWFQKFPFANKLLSPFRIFAPLMFESFDLSSYDLVISSSSAIYFAKSVITKPQTLHISYIHTPPRYLYGYTTAFDFKKNILIRILGETINHFLRIYDYIVSQRPDILVANSKNIARRIQKFYRRDSVVIYPPIDIARFENTKPSKDSKKYFLSLGRLVRGKRTEIVVEACTKLNLPLKVAGTGPELERLKAIAGPSIEFIGQVSDSQQPELYANAKATIVAAEDEDFGIVPVESQACGTPVIALNAGGFKETIVENKTGVFFDSSGIEALASVLESFDYTKFKEEDCRKQAQKFSKQVFINHLKKLVSENVTAHKS